MRLSHFSVRVSGAAGCGRAAVLALVAVLVACVVSPSPAVAQLCHRDGGYDPSEIAGSTFFVTREQTKFARSEPHYPIASKAAARYCFSRGCTGQLAVSWSDDEQRQLRALRAALVTEESAKSELQFIRIAVLRMETWLYARLAALDQEAVDRITRRIARSFGGARSEETDWVSNALSTFNRFDKECATYAMEATQHLLVLANLGLLKHWNVTAPVYRYGIPGHWTAGLENRETCERYRFDLNSRASTRHAWHVKGRDPAVLVQDNARAYSTLFPGMDRAGMGRPVSRPEMPAGASALMGPKEK